jgi:hypothetical protein
MEAEGRNMTFQEADRRYAELEQQHDAGNISDAVFEEQLQQLMIRDREGRWWAKSRKTGQ